VTLATENVPVEALLGGVANDLAAFAAARGVTVAVEAPEDLLVVGDRRRLAQVFETSSTTP